MKDKKIAQTEISIRKYCKKMGWDIKNLSPDQILKIYQK